MIIKQSIAALVILLSVSFSAFSATETIYYMADARASCGRNNVYGLSHSELADNFAAEVATCTHNPPVTRQRIFFKVAVNMVLRRMMRLTRAFLVISTSVLQYVTMVKRLILLRVNVNHLFLIVNANQHLMPLIQLVRNVNPRANNFLIPVAMKLSHGNLNVMVVIVLMLRVNMILLLGIHLYGATHLLPVIFALQKAAVAVLQLMALALGVVSRVGVMPVTRLLALRATFQTVLPSAPTLYAPTSKTQIQTKNQIQTQPMTLMTQQAATSKTLAFCLTIQQILLTLARLKANLMLRTLQQMNRQIRQ